MKAFLLFVLLVALSGCALGVHGVGDDEYFANRRIQHGDGLTESELRGASPIVVHTVALIRKDQQHRYVCSTGTKFLEPVGSIRYKMTCH